MMKTLKIPILFAFLALGTTPQAGAGLYTITFNDGNGDSGSGQIDVESANNSFYAADGYLRVIAGTASGFWTLYTGGRITSYPDYLTSPAGAYWYNNAVYPNGHNPQYPSANPLLDDYGLLFTQNNGNELNLWGNADGTYTLGGNIGGWQNFNVIISFGGTTIIPVQTVPEPSTMVAGILLLVPVGYGVFRTNRGSKILQ
jgi:hypothetical protein